MDFILPLLEEIKKFEQKENQKEDQNLITLYLDNPQLKQQMQDYIQEASILMFEWKMDGENILPFKKSRGLVLHDLSNLELQLITYAIIITVLADLLNNSYVSYHARVQRLSKKINDCGFHISELRSTLKQKDQKMKSQIKCL
jgi:hypothetical protein